MRIFALLCLVLLVASFPLVSDWLKHRNGDVDKQAIEKLVEDYIKNNPQKIIDSVTNFQVASIGKEMGNVVLKNTESLHDMSYPHFGNQDSKILVVEFFDYSCFYCKKMSDTVRALLDGNKVNYLFRDLPVLGENSIKAATAALAVHFIAPEKYLDFYYAALGASRDGLDDAGIAKIVADIGIKEEEFSSSLANNSEKIAKMIEKTRQLSRNLQISGTPSFVVGSALFIGATELEVINNEIDKQLAVSN